MTRTAFSCAVAAAALMLAGWGEGDRAGQPGGAPSGEASSAAGAKTIAAGTNQNSRFFQAAKAAGLDATLAGPGPYTVLVPADDAFGKLPSGTADNWMKPESR